MNRKAECEKMKSMPVYGADTCIFCGSAVPEGIMVCPNCVAGVLGTRCTVCGAVLDCTCDLCEYCSAELLAKGERK